MSLVSQRVCDGESESTCHTRCLTRRWVVGVQQWSCVELQSECGVEGVCAWPVGVFDGRVLHCSTVPASV